MKWVAGQELSDSERREPTGRGHQRLSHGRGDNHSSSSPFLGVSDPHQQDDGASGTEDGHSMDGDTAEEVGDETEYPPDPETPQERERFWQEVSEHAHDVPWNDLARSSL